MKTFSRWKHKNKAERNLSKVNQFNSLPTARATCLLFFLFTSMPCKTVRWCKLLTGWSWWKFLRLQIATFSTFNLKLRETVFIFFIQHSTLHPHTRCHHRKVFMEAYEMLMHRWMVRGKNPCLCKYWVESEKEWWWCWCKSLLSSRRNGIKMHFIHSWDEFSFAKSFLSLKSVSNSSLPTIFMHGWKEKNRK